MGNEFTNNSCSSSKIIVKGELAPSLEERRNQLSVSILSSAEGICLVSESESRLGFVEPASTSPSDANDSAAEPDDVPNKRRTTGVSTGEDVERLYVKIPIG